VELDVVVARPHVVDLRHRDDDHAEPLADQHPLERTAGWPRGRRQRRRRDPLAATPPLGRPLERERETLRAERLER